MTVERMFVSPETHCMAEHPTTGFRCIRLPNHSGPHANGSRAWDATHTEMVVAYTPNPGWYSSGLVEAVDAANAEGAMRTYIVYTNRPPDYDPRKARFPGSRDEVKRGVLALNNFEEAVALVEGLLELLRFKAPFSPVKARAFKFLAQMRGKGDGQ